MKITIHSERDALFEKYKNLLEINKDLSRKIVSNQANKITPFFRWFRYKEAFSESLVNYILAQLNLKPGLLLDPFAGVGSALFAAREKGWKTTGIELLPVGNFVINARLEHERISSSEMRVAIDQLRTGVWKKSENPKRYFEHVSITAGAYPEETEKLLQCYLDYCNNMYTEGPLKTLLIFAAYAILESISYTRKDGQYLRWDGRSGRSYASKNFNKGPIFSFEDALFNQLEAMWQDLTIIPGDLFNSNDKGIKAKPVMTVFADTCLKRLAMLPENTYDLILTSPPYCNRYDYTRTYALELIFLGADDTAFKEYRQAMLSCTVENRDKIDWLRQNYSKKLSVNILNKSIEAYENQKALQEVITILDIMRRTNKLNNPNIVRLVRNYFLEMSIVIHECTRILKAGGYFVMINDNVSYQGEDIPVDFILSSFAESAGLGIKRIWQLSKGKGNSSQQMGRHGRAEQRKCVYLWFKPRDLATSE